MRIFILFTYLLIYIYIYIFYKLPAHVFPCLMPKLNVLVSSSDWFIELAGAEREGKRDKLFASGEHEKKEGRVVNSLLSAN